MLYIIITTGAEVKISENKTRIKFAFRLMRGGGYAQNSSVPPLNYLLISFIPCLKFTAIC